ncbi:replication protein [Bordetella bronchiseptica]|uniref:replication protein n=1 Tax=Bordetella bronchiseptica TaxID=518 RepID=UPI0009B80E50|nr:replication protein [Bordetella bronchiseptica]
MIGAARSPQVEDGHIKLANELYEAIIAFEFSKTQLRVLLAVLRKTYGYGKKEDDMSASQLGALLGEMKRQHITTALNELAAMRVITKRPGKYGSVVGVNKDYSAWVDSPKSGQVNESRTSPNLGQVNENGTTTSPKSGQVASPKSGHTKDNLPKDNQQKESADADSFGQPARLSLIPTPPPVIALPVKDGSEFEITEDLVAEWSAAFPGVDVLAEIAKARVWLRASPQNLKTRRGMGRFVVGWLSRSARPSPSYAPVRKSAHGNFQQQDYRAGVGSDGSF